MTQPRANLSRPNTRVSDELVRENVLLCCGEDARELLLAVNKATQNPLQTFHEYRCYQFWAFQDFTLILTGIGSGCMEPLLCELLEPGVVRNLILVGTAGGLNPQSVSAGEVYAVQEAYPGGCAVRPAPESLPLRPRFAIPEHLHIPAASSVSTDYYYGFSLTPDDRAQRLINADPSLAEDIATHRDVCDLVEMECAQLYHLCGALSDDLQYLALKGVSNTVDAHHEQSANSVEVMKRVVKAGLACLGVE